MQSDWVTFQQLQFEQFKQFQEIQFQQFQRFQVKQIETWKARHSGPTGNVDRVSFPMTLGFDELAYPYLAKHLRHSLSVPESNHPQVISLPSRHAAQRDRAEPVFLQSLLSDFQLPESHGHPHAHAHQHHPLHHQPHPERVPVLALHSSQTPLEDEQHARQLFEEVKESMQEAQHAREVYKEVKDSIRAENREDQHARHVFNEVKDSIRSEQQEAQHAREVYKEVKDSIRAENREDQHARHVFNEVKDSLFHHQQHAHPHGAPQAHSHGAHQPHPHPVQQRAYQPQPVHVTQQHVPQAYPAQRQAHTPPSQHAQSHPHGYAHANQAKFPQLGHEDPAAAHSLFDFITRQLYPEREQAQIPVTRERPKPAEADMSQVEKLKSAYRASHPQTTAPDTKTPEDHAQASSWNAPPDQAAPHAEAENPEAHSFNVLETAARDYESVLLELQQAGSDSHACHIAQAKLMKLLLLLDDLHCSEDARPVRKALVTKINQTLDKLEQAKTAIRASQSSIPVPSESEQSEQVGSSSDNSEPAKVNEPVSDGVQEPTVESNPVDEPSNSSEVQSHESQPELPREVEQVQQAEISSGSGGVENLNTESSEVEQNKASSPGASGEVIIEDVPVSE